MTGDIQSTRKKLEELQTEIRRLAALKDAMMHKLWEGHRLAGVQGRQAGSTPRSSSEE